MWIKTVGGEYINMDRVDSFDVSKDGSAHNLTLTLSYVQGRREPYNATIFRTTYEDLEKRLCAYRFMPSPPGYVLLSYYPTEEAGEETITRWPVLGWNIDIESEYHEVVTAWSRMGELDKHEAIACPNGCVMRPGDCCWPDEASWLEEMRRQKPEKDAA